MNPVDVDLTDVEEHELNGSAVAVLEEEPEADWTPPAEETVYSVPASAIGDFHDKLREATDRVASTALDLAHAEATRKAAKKAHDAAVKLLDELANRGPEALPLFDGNESGNGKPADSPAATTADAAGEDDDWREIEVGVLSDLPESLVNKLMESDLGTIGALADYTASGKLLIDIKGIGQAKVEKIEAALEKFWASRKQ